MFSSWCSCSIVIKFDLGVDSVKESSFELYWVLSYTDWSEFKRLFQKIFLFHIKKNEFSIVNIRYITKRF
jgi:hypothetical protein